MGAFDNATWQALGLVLTLLGLGVSLLVWTRRGAASGLRAVAWSLLPLAAALTGVLRLLWEIADSVVRWAGGLVFSPVVWLGVAVAGLSVVLFLVSGVVGRRTSRRASRTAVPSKGSRQQPAVGPAAGRKTGSPPAAGRRDDGLEGMEDIEEILRKHGIG
jgi:hypothetical protein